MALELAQVGRFAVLVLLLTQCGFLTAFPVWYTGELGLIPLALLYAPTLFYRICCTEGELVETFYTWFLYIVVALIPHTAITFALCGDELDTDYVLGPNCLKVILCMTPIVFLVLVNTATDFSKHEEYRELVKTLSVQVTIDLFDSVEMLDIVLDEKENSHGISRGFGIAMIVVACLSFLLSLVQMAETKLEDGKVSTNKEVAIVGNALQIGLVNLPFMIMRLVVFVKYSKDESIFIAKNGIAIFLSALQIYWIKLELNTPDQ